MAIEAGLPARAAALAILDSVLAGKQPLEQAMAAEHLHGSLSGPDVAFVRLLIATTLRRLGEIDQTLARHLRKPLDSSAGKVRQILRLGAAQLVFLATPPHAAVDTSVRMVKSIGFGGFSGLVNAVLRRVAGTPMLDDEAAARANTPEWLWQSWTAAYGEAMTVAIATAHLHEAPLDITVKDGFEIEPSSIDAVVLPTGSLRCAKATNPVGMPGFADGGYWVQDAAAALPARLIPDPKGKRVIDLCAAPGGKTAQLAAAGALVTAVDRSAERLRRLGENLRRLGLGAEIVVDNATQWRPKGKADAVLLDAPCSATGTIRRHPDIPHLKQPDDPDRLARMQQRLLEAASEMIRPGGLLIYSVCSLQPEEGPTAVEAFLARHRDFSRAAIGHGEIPGSSEFMTSYGDLRTLPCQWQERGGIDGFYIARLRRA